MKWKLNAIEPSTCDGATQGKGCRILYWWDAELPAASRAHTLAAMERVCAAHADATPIPTGVIRGFDGNWKPLPRGSGGSVTLRQSYDDYIEYQRAWFRWSVRNEVAARDQEVPAGLAGFVSEPVTTGSLAEPPQEQRDALERVHGRARENDQRRGLAESAIRTELSTIDLSRASFTWSGAGDDRVLTVNVGGQLTTPQRNRVQAACDIQFGVGRVVVA